jgi:hypothetical protein
MILLFLLMFKELSSYRRGILNFSIIIGSFHHGPLQYYKQYTFHAQNTMQLCTMTDNCRFVRVSLKFPLPPKQCGAGSWYLIGWVWQPFSGMKLLLLATSEIGNQRTEEKAGALYLQRGLISSTDVTRIVFNFHNVIWLGIQSDFRPRYEQPIRSSG